MSEEIKNAEIQAEETKSDAVESTESAAAAAPAEQPVYAPAEQNKKMTNCKSCGVPMAKSAKACPNCGAKNKKPIYKRPIFIVAALIAVYIIFNLLSGLKKPEAVVNAEDLIKAIGTVSLESEDAIIAAEKAVNDLTAEEKERVGKLDKLEKARAKYDELVAEAEVEEIQNAIKAIGTVSLESYDKIKAARTAYDESDDAVKEKITNLNVLEAAEKEYSALNVTRVIALINEIGEVTLKSEDKIKAAKDAFDSLTKEDEAKVTNAKVLTDAKTKFDSLKKAEREAKAKAALSKLKSKYDRVEGRTWYYPSTYPQYVDTRCFVLPYIGRNDSGHSWLRLEMNYTGDDWIFWTKITFVVDGEKYYKYFSYYDVERDNDTEVWEYVDISPTDADVEMLRKIATSKETIVRFEGDNYRKDITISAADKTSIKQVLEAYDILTAE